MPDVLDQIIEMLPPSTLDLVLRQEDASFRLGEELDCILKETQALQLTQATKELQGECLSAKSKLTENSNLLNKLLKEIKSAESLIKNNEHEQNIEASKKKLAGYDAQIKEIQKKLGDVDCVKLFTDIEALYKEKEELKKNIAQVKSNYECFNGLPPTIEGAKKAIEDIKERIRAYERETEAVDFK